MVPLIGADHFLNGVIDIARGASRDTYLALPLTCLATLPMGRPSEAEIAIDRVRGFLRVFIAAPLLSYVRVAASGATLNR